MRVLDISDSFETGSSPTVETSHMKLGDDGLGVSESTEKWMILENSGSAFIAFRTPQGMVPGFLWNEGTDGDGAQFRYSWGGTAALSQFEWRAGGSELRMFLSGDGYLRLGGGSTTTTLTNEQFTSVFTAVSANAAQSISCGTFKTINSNNDAFSGVTRVVMSDFRRTITTNTTDTSIQGGFYGVAFINPSTGVTYTQSSTIGHANFIAGGVNNIGAGSLSMTGVVGFYVAAENTNTGTNKYGFYCDTQSGATNNYAFYAASTANVSAFLGGIRTKKSTANITTPTAAELTSAFGAPSATAVGSGFIGVVDDNGGDSKVFLVVSNGTSWFYSADFTKAS